MTGTGDSHEKRAGVERAPTRSYKAWRNWGDHPLVAILTVLASVAGILGYLNRGSDGPSAAGVGAIPPAGNAAAPEPDGRDDRCADVAGRWDWLTTGGVVAIAETGTMKWYRLASDAVPTLNGSWECSGTNPRHLTFRWVETGFVDTVVLSRDGQRFSGANLKSGFLLSGTRAR